jgi:hypothetical protein
VFKVDLADSPQTPLGPSGIRDLAQLLVRGSGIGINQVSLRGCALGSDGMRTLSTALARKVGVTSLDVSNNDLLDAGCEAMANMLINDSAITCPPTVLPQRASPSCPPASR